jgi:hypothetical protein
MLLILLLVMIGGIYSSAKAQYYVQSTTTYAWDTSPSTSVSTTSADDAAFSLTIPFSFNFFGTAYTTCYVSTNGLMTFGATSTAWTNQCLPNTTTPNNLIAAYWDDLYFDYSCSPTYWRYGTSGTTPNRIFTVSWIAFRTNGGSCGTYVYTQIKLFETSNIIEVHLQSNSLGTSGSIGIENAAGTVGYQAICNSTTTNATAWRWTPCATPGTPTTLLSTATGTTTANISWNAGSPIGTPTVTYYWNIYNSGGTLITSGNTTGTSAAITGLTCGTSYYFTVYAYTSCSGTSSSTAISGNFSTNNCEMIVPSSGNNSYTVCSGNIYDYGGSTGNYSVSTSGYTVLYPATVGNVIQISGVSSVGESCCDYISVYNGVGTGGALLGTYYMGTNVPTLISGDATGALTILFYSDVSVVDAGFNIAISCVLPCTAPGTPINLSSSVTGNSTASISWNAGSPAGSPTVSFNWSLYTSLGVLSNSGNTTATSVSLSGLNCGASYYFTVYASTTCGSLNSATATSSNFTTWAPSSYILPFTDGFNPIKDCWTQQYVTGASNVAVTTSSSYPTTTPQEGTSYLYWNSYSYSSGQETRFYTPPLNSTGVNDVLVRFFWMHDAGYVGYTDGVYVDWSTNGTTWTNAAYVQRYDATLTGWNKKEILLPAGAGNQPTLYVCLRFYSNFGNNCSLDNLWIGKLWSDPLPITLISFNGNCENGKVKLNWSTASEENNDHFIVRESSDLENWVPIKIITGAGNSNKQLDYFVSLEGNGDMYYMLSQTDYDGKETRFEPIFVSCSENTPETSINPNPTSSLVNIETTAENIFYQLMDTQGNLILSGSEKVLDLQKFATGMYFMKISDANTGEIIYSGKVIKK